jgi:hypothetical protein
VRVIGVRFPVHPEYAAQAPADKIAEIDAFLLKHGVSRIIDLQDAVRDPRYFQDEDHLNEYGAIPAVRLLGQRLGQRIL